MSTQYELPALEAPAEPPSSAPRLRVVPAVDGAVEHAPLDFEDFVRRHTPRLRRLVLRRMGDVSAAEEIAQETLLRAHQHLATLRTEDELAAWTTVVGQRLAIDRLRVRGRSVAMAEVPEDARIGRDTAEIVVARAEARTALDSLEAIPERQAAVLWAREVEGRSYDEIAERFDLTEPAVRSLLHRGRRALRAEYAARGGTLPLRSLVPLAPALLALRGINRLRSAARQTVRGHAPAFATMSLAAVVALGMTVGSGIGGLRTTPPADVIGADQLDQSTYSVSAVTSGDVRATDVVASVTPAAARPSTPRAALTAVLPAACTRTASRSTCIQPDADMRGDVLYIGPELPENPVVERVSVSSNYVAICETTPTTPVTQCESGSTRRSELPQTPAPSNTAPIGAQK